MALSGDRLLEDKLYLTSLACGIEEMPGYYHIYRNSNYTPRQLFGFCINDFGDFLIIFLFFTFYFDCKMSLKPEIAKQCRKQFNNLQV